jgi:hypothetical protein
VYITLLETKWHSLAEMSNFDLWSKITFSNSAIFFLIFFYRFNGSSFQVPTVHCIDSSNLGEQPPATVRYYHRGHPGRPLEPDRPDPPAEQLEVHAGSEEHPPCYGGHEPRTPEGIFYTIISQIFFVNLFFYPTPLSVFFSILCSLFSWLISTSSLHKYFTGFV